MNTAGLAQVRCPKCNRLAAEASVGATVRVRCARCGAQYEWRVREPVREGESRRAEGC